MLNNLHHDTYNYLKNNSSFNIFKIIIVNINHRNKKCCSHIMNYQHIVCEYKQTLFSMFININHAVNVIHT